LTVDGGSAMNGGTVWGIRYDESDGWIHRVHVLNIRNPSGGSQGVGIRVQSTTGAPADVDVSWSHVENYTRAGINGNGTGVDLDVFNNTVTGPVSPTVWAPNGIQISRGAKGEVRFNIVDNNPSPNPPGGGGSGIILFCAGRTSVFGNRVTDADLGISIADNQHASVSQNIISDSVFDAISLQFIGMYFGDIGCGVTPARHNWVAWNHALDSGDTGISFFNYDGGSDSTTPDHNVVSFNRIDGSALTGIRVYESSLFSFPFAAPSDNWITKNWIKNTGSSGIDAQDDTAGGGTAGTANFWNKNACVTSLPAGLCQ
jgi:hypothetical protein